VIPGVSSALAGPSFVGIPVTQRGAAESLVICTGVGRGGKSVCLPSYSRSRTLVILMGVARLSSILSHLQKQGYPNYVPIAIVERASSPDQRLIAGTLEGIERVLASSEVGEQRTPGMIVVGWAVLSLDGSKGDLDVLDDASREDINEDGLEKLDMVRVNRWLGGKYGIIRDGLTSEWEQFV
jgi:uroporphyrin-III C-methyltransferase